MEKIEESGKSNQKFREYSRSDMEELQKRCLEWLRQMKRKKKLPILTPKNKNGRVIKEVEKSNVTGDSSDRKQKKEWTMNFLLPKFLQDLSTVEQEDPELST